MHYKSALQNENNLLAAAPKQNGADVSGAAPTNTTVSGANVNV